MPRPRASSWAGGGESESDDSDAARAEAEAWARELLSERFDGGRRRALTQWLMRGGGRAEALMAAVRGPPVARADAAVEPAGPPGPGHRAAARAWLQRLALEASDRETWRGLRDWLLADSRHVAAFLAAEEELDGP